MFTGKFRIPPVELKRKFGHIAAVSTILFQLGLAACGDPLPTTVPEIYNDPFNNPYKNNAVTTSVVKLTPVPTAESANSLTEKIHEGMPVTFLTIPDQNGITKKYGGKITKFDSEGMVVEFGPGNSMPLEKIFDQISSADYYLGTKPSDDDQGSAESCVVQVYGRGKNEIGKTYPNMILKSLGIKYQKFFSSSGKTVSLASTVACFGFGN